MAEAKPSADRKAPKTTRRVEVVGTADVPVLYSNYVSLHATRADFLLTFADARSTEATVERVAAKALVQVYLSPHTFRAVTNMLVENLKNYEAKHGKIETEKLSAEEKGREP